MAGRHIANTLLFLCLWGFWVLWLVFMGRVFKCPYISGWGLVGLGLVGWGLVGWGLAGWGLVGWGLVGWGLDLFWYCLSVIG